MVNECLLHDPRGRLLQMESDAELLDSPRRDRCWQFIGGDAAAIRLHAEDPHGPRGEVVEQESRVSVVPRLALLEPDGLRLNDEPDAARRELGVSQRAVLCHSPGERNHNHQRGPAETGHDSPPRNCLVLGRCRRSLRGTRVVHENALQCTRCHEVVILHADYVRASSDVKGRLVLFTGFFDISVSSAVTDL